MIKDASMNTDKLCTFLNTDTLCDYGYSWHMHTHMRVPEHNHQWTELGIYDNPWPCFHEFTGIKCFINYDTYKWLTCIIIQPAVSINHIRHQ